MKVTVDQIEARLKELPQEKLLVAYDFVSYLAEKNGRGEARATLLASEAVLRRDWDRPEEDAAWASL